MRIVNKLNESEKIPRNFGIDFLITPSDIHLIQVVGDNPESNVRTISEILGVTPGAASQQLSKLSKRGLIVKERGLKNEKEVTLSLTDQGRIAYKNHDIIHEMIYQRLIHRIGPLNDDELQVLLRVLYAIESVYDERIMEVRRGETMKLPSDKKPDSKEQAS
ncbi:MarR family winged helix-turn-helix transcriptional regulator [Methanospirillum sp. J.3.6.1-F.2.7.3]|uniref:MarR family winged helix-turn-helix transcriptional regulator n=1 Tax=Methanospirillum purgamenti TaxID=2834276 RepID=A0A8E7EGD3_9EURY|nr:MULTISPECIES: MarR family winged helix-turn-helix transcriptional regulator [Methanospirillum]QVV87717.1 MarR family winged helix-turn-helix transcriptional regulator [Methanospirillum sp. J.3.6.1-F.2.7.3]